MERGDFEGKRRGGSGSVRAAINQYGDRNGVVENSPSLKKPQKDSSEPSWKARELHKARMAIDRYRESRNAAESMKAEAEFELVNAKKTVKSLSSLIEKSNSKLLARTQGFETTNKSGLQEERVLAVKNTENYQYSEVMRELEFVKQELSKLKLDVASVLEEKSRAEKEREVSIAKLQSYSSSMELLRKEIEEVNEEQVLVELARIEALKEHGEIEAQRRKEAEEFASAIEKNRKEINELVEEIECSRELENKLAVTISDVNLLENELKLLKEIDRKAQRNDRLINSAGSSQKDEAETSTLFHSVVEELEAAKKELASIKDEGFQFMTSMDIIRNELKHVKEETARLKKTEEQADLTVQNLNSKLLRAKAKLEAVSAAEEKAKSIVSNLCLTFEQLKTEVETAKKEKELMSEETENLKAEIQKAESEIVINEEKLHDAMQELEAVKSSESSALETLKSLTESTMISRASASQHSSSIIISKFEYEYLTGRAVEAEEIADKKVAAAQAWIEALKASEREILMKYEISKKEIKEIRMEEQKQAYRAERSLSAKRTVEGEQQIWGTKREKNSEEENLRQAIPRKSMKSSGNLTPRRAKFSKSASPGARNVNRSGSFTIKKRKKVVPQLAKLFGSKKIDSDE